MTRRPVADEEANIGGAATFAALAVQRQVWKTSEVVAFAVVRYIVDHDLRAGDRLPLEAEMVEHYHVSRESLREALRLLEAQGIVSIRRGPSGGPVVGRAESTNLARTMTLYFQLAGATYSELLRAWRTLEPVAAELAARNPARAAVARELHSHLEQFDDGGVRSAYMEHSNGLHFSVTDLADNKVLGLIIGAVGDIIRTHVILRLDPFELRDLIDEDHAAIAAAVIDGDPDRARRAMAGHVDRLDPIYRANWEGDLSDPIEWK
jgi:DNA-binding FadR family transcriptional regulator